MNKIYSISEWDKNVSITVWTFDIILRADRSRKGNSREREREEKRERQRQRQREREREREREHKLMDD